jgi:hypothetical protein
MRQKLLWIGWREARRVGAEQRGEDKKCQEVIKADGHI